MTKPISVLWFALMALTAQTAAAQTRQMSQNQLQTFHSELSRSSNNGASALRGFSVVLVEGNLRPATTAPEALSPAAAKALADLRDFLPYKSFRLLDTQWTIGTGRMTGRLRGPEGKIYALDVTQGLAVGDPTSVTISRFVVSEVTSASGGRPQSLTFSNSAEAPGHHGDAPSPFSQSQDASGHHGDAAASWYLGQASPLMDASFRMKVGETVVVGTSHLQGDTALIVLLTAVPSGDKTLNSGR
jgi:hypothetical protein